MNREVFTTERLRAFAGDLSGIPGQDAVRRAAELLRAGGLVALPTETVYGLGANALDEGAVEKIFIAKGRPHWDPLIVHVSDFEMMERVVRDIPDGARRLMEAFWPGPLTLLLPRDMDLPRAVTAGRDLVGVRMPRHPVAVAIIRAAGVPVAAPSANRFGHVSPTSALHVLADLDGLIDAVVDGGPTKFGLESTVLDASRVPMILYRPGAVTMGEINAVGGAVERFIAPSSNDAPESLPSPGVGIRHYAPRARILLVEDERALLAEATKNDVRTGVMLPAGWTVPKGAIVFAWERWDDLQGLARTMFAGLRELDEAGVEVIVCPLPEERKHGTTDALRDRLMKAARPA